MTVSFRVISTFFRILSRVSGGMVVHATFSLVLHANFFRLPVEQFPIFNMGKVYLVCNVAELKQIRLPARISEHVVYFYLHHFHNRGEGGIFLLLLFNYTLK